MAEQLRLKERLHMLEALETEQAHATSKGEVELEQQVESIPKAHLPGADSQKVALTFQLRATNIKLKEEKKRARALDDECSDLRKQLQRAMDECSDLQNQLHHVNDSKQASLKPGSTDAEAESLSEARNQRDHLEAQVVALTYQLKLVRSKTKDAKRGDNNLHQTLSNTALVESEY